MTFLLLKVPLLNAELIIKFIIFFCLPNRQQSRALIIFNFASSVSVLKKVLNPQLAVTP